MQCEPKYALGPYIHLVSIMRLQEQKNKGDATLKLTHGKFFYGLKCPMLQLQGIIQSRYVIVTKDNFLIIKLLNCLHMLQTIIK
jgi:hypothetical protein